MDGSAAKQPRSTKVCLIQAKAKVNVKVPYSIQRYDSIVIVCFFFFTQVASVALHLYKIFRTPSAIFLKHVFSSRFASQKDFFPVVMREWRQTPPNSHKLKFPKALYLYYVFYGLHSFSRGFLVTFQRLFKGLN